MKFAETLKSHLTAEWRSQYIDYDLLKDILENYKQEWNADVSMEDMLTTTHDKIAFTKFQEEFFGAAEHELTKIETFFMERLNASNRKLRNLQAEVAKTKKLRQQPNRRKSSEDRTSRGEGLSFLPTATRSLARLPKRSVAEQHAIRSQKDLKCAFSEYYLSLILLQNYQELNFTGFRKIMKKYDKVTETAEGAAFRAQKVEISTFYTSKNVDQNILDVETTMTELEEGDRKKALQRLRVPPLESKNNLSLDEVTVIFRFGMCSGAAIVCFVLTGYYGYHHSREYEFLRALWFYRTPMWIWIFTLLMGLNVYAFRSFGVNHILIFEIDPRNNLSHHNINEMGGFLAIIWATSLNLYIYHEYVFASNSAIRSYLPQFTYLFYLIFLLNPFNVGYRSARYWLLRRLLRCFTAGLTTVEFADFWLADQLNSLAVLFTDSTKITCQFLYPLPSPQMANASSIEIHKVESCLESDSNVTIYKETAKITELSCDCQGVNLSLVTLVACIPAMMRFVQCLRRYYDSGKWFPHLVNAGKYGTGICTILLSSVYHSKGAEAGLTLYRMFLMGNLIKTIYVLIWDFKMDWGFFDNTQKEHPLLREEIVYSNPAWYYAAMVQNFLIRFRWIAYELFDQRYLRLRSLQAPVHERTIFLVRTASSTLEIYRRFCWNFFRLENEHLNNCGEFRAVRDISIAPIKDDDITKLERMMDRVLGVKNRSKKNSEKDFKR